MYVSKSFTICDYIVSKQPVGMHFLFFKRMLHFFVLLQNVSEKT